VIFDAGCGLGYKAAWFAKLAPHATVIGMDFSESALQSAKKYADIDNLYFIQGDIAKTPFKDGIVDYVNCDQVIMHTEYPEKTFAHLSAKTSENGEFACYIYAKKALPRELLDDYFRREVHGITNEQLWEVSEQLTELGKRLSDLKVTFESPDIPLLGIKGGEYDIQRFIYWNFIKCFWNPELGKDISDATNFDWYSPSNARRYTESEFREMISDSNMEDSYFYIQEAAYSGRFIHKK
jgi:ubiquinone/menaquinone biosynthesis C-methylase UbiE